MFQKRLPARSIRCIKSDKLSCVRALAVSKSNKPANREPSSCNQLGAFCMTCFARVCMIFLSPWTAIFIEERGVCDVCRRDKGVATWSSRCAFTSFMTSYICAVCFVFLSTDKNRCETY